MNRFLPLAKPKARGRGTDWLEVEEGVAVGVAAGRLVVGADSSSPFSSRPQCLQTMAASWISSAQNGQVFIIASL